MSTAEAAAVEVLLCSSWGTRECVGASVTLGEI